MNDRMVIELEHVWQFMEKGITKGKRILEGLPEPPFNSEDYMMLYTTIYNMCTQKPPHDYSQQLYDNYKQAFVDYINLTVYQQISRKAKDVVIALIDVEREGGQIDRALLKNVLDIYLEIGMGQMEYYEKDFETHMLEDTAAYYSRKASSWILEDSCPEYMLKSEECLRKEKDRVAHYLHSSSVQKLLEVEDLSRMYRLYNNATKGLQPIRKIFKQHITDEGTALVQQAKDAAMSKVSVNIDTIRGKIHEVKGSEKRPRKRAKRRKKIGPDKEISRV